MATTTTPNHDDERRRAKLERSSTYGREGTPSGVRSTEIRREDPAPRVIRSTDELLGEILKRPGQYFLVEREKDYTGGEYRERAYIEFSDGSHVEVQFQ